MKVQAVLLVGTLLVSAVAGAMQERRTSLDQAVSDARERYPGRVISAQTDRRDGHEYHNVRILTRDGRVRRYRVDAEAQRPRPRRPSAPRRR